MSAMLPSIFVVLLSATFALAQSSNTICTKNATTSFLFNANGESPCVVWSKLQSLCLPSERFINVPPLADRTWGYNSVMPSEKDSLCQCNVVAYALMAGCSWCQVGDANSWVTEQRWRQNCAAYNATSISFAQIVLPLPAYAFRSWQDQRWNPSDALVAARGPPTVAPVIATTTLSRSFGPLPSSTGPSTKPLPDPDAVDEYDNTPNKAKIGAIIGGVVGGVILFIMALLMLAYWKKQNRFEEDRQKGMEEGEGSGRRKGAPAGLPPFRDPYAQGQGGGPTTGLLAMLTGAGKKSGEKGTDRISRWSETFFTNPRKAPRPFSSRKADDRTSRYTTTTERRRDKGVSSSGGSSFDGTFDQSTAPSPMSPWDDSRALARSLLVPPTAGLKPSLLSNQAASRSQREYRETTSTMRSSPRKPVPQRLPRESFADRWSDQSSVFTFATKKGRSNETLPSFSTSVKDIKDHRTALAKRVADEEARVRAADEQRWNEGRAIPPQALGRRESSGSTSEIVLGAVTGAQASKKKSRKGKTVANGEVEEDGEKLKRKKKKKRSSNTPGTKPSPTDTLKSSPSSSRRAPARSSFARKAISTYSAAPSDMPEYEHKPLPIPPIVFAGHQPSIRSPGPLLANSIDFSVAAPRTPLTARSRVSHPFARVGRRTSVPFSPKDLFPEPQTARYTMQTVDFPIPTPRPSSTQPLSTSRPARGRNGSRSSDLYTADFAHPRPSPHPTLPSLYEPKAGAGVYDVPPVPHRGREEEVESDLGSPISRYPVSTLHVAN